MRGTANSRTLPLPLPLSLSLSLSLSGSKRNLTQQPNHNDPDLSDKDLQPQFQYTDSSRSTDCALPKPLAAASQYLEPPVRCSSVVLLGTDHKQVT